MRERLGTGTPSFASSGITPACAGTTIVGRTPCIRIEDHPRLCGNDATSRQYRWEQLGSPPLVRERPVSVASLPPVCRITPACAGTTLSLISSNLINRDHPRLCGNDKVLRVHFAKSRGSPPLVRERPWATGDGMVADGITPACAGTTCSKGSPAGIV